MGTRTVTTCDVCSADIARGSNMLSFAGSEHLAINEVSFRAGVVICLKCFCEKVGVKPAFTQACLMADLNRSFPFR